MCAIHKAQAHMGYLSIGLATVHVMTKSVQSGLGKLAASGCIHVGVVGTWIPRLNTVDL